MRAFPIVLAVLATGTASAADNDLAKRVDALELSSYTNTVSLSGFLESRFEKGTMKPSTGDSETHSINTMIGGIDFKSTPSDRVSIFGRWVFTSSFNPNNSDSDEATANWTDGRGYVDSQVYFERFFANIKLMDNLQFTFGRLPTVDGPPAHFADSLPRQGSYPKWIYPAAVDGYALTYNVPISSSQGLAIRAIHSPVTYLNSSFAANSDWKFKAPTTTGQDLTGAPVSEKYRDGVDIKSFMLDYNNSSIGFARDFNAILQYMNFQNFQFAPTLDADYTHQLLYVEANHLVNTGLSLWMAYSMTEVKSRGYVAYQVAPTIYVPISTMANTADGSGKGKGTAIGLNYALPIEAMNNPSLGAEYISNDEKYVLFELTPRQMFDIYGIHGKANHIYWSQPVFPGVKFRVGTMMLTPTHNWGYVGAPTKTENKYSSVYANIRLDF